MTSANDSSKFNADELIAPKWLNEIYIENIVRSFETKNADIKLVNYNIAPATGKSDHYVSVMFRIKATYTLDNENKVQAMIFKTAPEMEGQKQDLVENTSVFETEIRMYSEALPKIEAVLRKYGDQTKLCAKLLYFECAPRKVMVFEDLAEKGYGVISSRSCTLDEVKLALAKLAKIHAISYKLAMEGDTNIANYEKGMVNSFNVFEFPIMRDAVRIFKELIAEQADLKAYLPHIEKIEKDMLPKCIDSFNAYKNGERKGIFVLNHGDFHVKNMMVKYDDKNQFRDLLMVDYQMSIFSSPAVDILYGSVMLYSAEMRRNQLDELLYFYYSNLKKTLELVQFAGRIPKLQDIRDEINKFKSWELFLYICFLVINHVLQHSDGDLAKCVEDESYRKKLWRSAEVQEQLRFILPRLLHQGYFEE